MNPQLSKLVSQLTESETIAMTRKSNELRAEGIDVISMSLGEPDFPTPQHIKDAAKRAIDNNISHYAPVAGFPELREAIVNKFQNENSLTYQSENIMVSNGAKHTITNILMAILNPGDEVILPAPYWVSYREMVKLAGGINRVVKAGIEQEFKITPQQLKDSITNKTKILILNSPSNPSGAVYSKQELIALAKVIERHPNLFVISDEVYEHIMYEGVHFSLAQIDDIKTRVIVVNSVSKSYAMTGWRIGYMAGPPWLIKACTNLQGQVTSGANSIAQMAAIAALTESDDDTVKMRNIFRARRDRLIEGFKSISGLKVMNPQGAFYLFPDVSTLFNRKFNDRLIRNSEDLSWYLLEEAHVATVPGSAFGSPESIRLSYATSDKNIEIAMKRIISKIK